MKKIMKERKDGVLVSISCVFYPKYEFTNSFQEESIKGFLAAFNLILIFLGCIITISVQLCTLRALLLGTSPIKGKVYEIAEHQSKT